MRLVILSVVLILLASVSSCSDTYDEVTAAHIEEKLKSSINDTAVSWWHAGQDAEYFYLVEKRPMEENRYKVPRETLQISIDGSSGGPLQKDEWLNLKLVDIKFR